MYASATRQLQQQQQQQQGGTRRDVDGRRKDDVRSDDISLAASSPLRAEQRR